MTHYDEEITRIRDLLKKYPKGMSISEIARALSLTRESTARYLDTLRFSGQAEMRNLGPAKIYTLATRFPLSSFINIFSSPMLIIDKEFFILEVNDALLRMFSLPREDVVGHSMLHSKLSGSYAGAFEENVQSVIEGKSFATEQSFERGGKRFSFIVRMVPVTDDTGEPCATIVLEDITELKNYQQHLERMVQQRTKDLEETNERLKCEMEGHRRAKDAIQVSMQKYRALVEDMSACVCNYEPDGTLTFVNENFCEFVQKPVEELTGIQVFSLISPKNEAIVRDALKKPGHSDPATTITLEFPRPDGTTIWQQWTIRAFFDKRGKITEYQSIGIDITDRICTEKKLAEQEKKHNAVIRGSPLPQLVIDTGHRIVSWNTAMEHFSGLPASRMIGATTFGTIFYDRDRPLLADLIIDGKFDEIAEIFPENCKKSSYLDGTWEGITFSNIHHGGGRWVYFTAAVIRDENDVISHVVETMAELEGYRTQDGTSFVVRSLFPLIDKNALRE
ncbi:MAG: PAS domain S-box protein [Methanoregula sp.]|jgi:PAS domain S-box-containing protein